MVKSKKMSKTSIAIIVLALLLVLSLVMGMTGAWFTSTEQKSDTFTFGNVNIALSDLSGAIGTRSKGHTSVEGSKIMPGDTINFTLEVENTGDQSVWYVAHVGVSEDNGDADLAAADNISGDYVYVGSNWVKVTYTAPTEMATGTTNLVELAPGSSNKVTGNLSITLDGATYTDTWEGKVITITVDVYAIQAANMNALEAYGYLVENRDSNVAANFFEAAEAAEAIEPII